LAAVADAETSGKADGSAVDQTPMVPPQDGASMGANLSSTRLGSGNISPNRLSLRRALLVTSTLAGLPLFPQMAAALDVVVTNKNDSGAGSLRAAIAATNGSADPTNNILFANNLEGMLALSSDLSITKPVSIDFRTTSQVALTGNVGIGIGTSGVVTLNTIHNYTGDTALLAGTLMSGGPSHGLNFGLFGSTESLLVMSPGTTFIVVKDSVVDLQNVSGVGTIANNGILELFGSTGPTTRTFSGTISGSGALTMFGGRETLILSGPTTYSGPTTIFGSADFFITSSTPFAELRAGTTNAFSPNSDFLLTGAATLNLNNFNQAIGSLTGSSVSGPQPQVLLGSATLTVGGTNSSGTFAGAITGTGGIVKTGSGTFTLTGTNSYSGGTIISAGTLQLGNGGATGSIAGDVADNANFAIKRSDAFTFSGVISGSGALHQLGTGSTTLTAIESYGGSTSIAAGRLALSGAGNIATSSGVLADGAFDISGVSGAGTSIQTLSGSGSVALGTKTLTLTNASGDFAGAIGGTGGLTLAAGKETLSGLNTYTGATNVNAGTLTVNGSIASSSLTTVNPGGTLAGNGTIGNTTINGGTLAPGNSIGTLTVQGNLVFAAAASYMVEVSPANADRTNVSGTAALGGATVKASFAPGTYISKQYTILHATGGVNGTFNALATTDLPANFNSSLSYDSNNAYLNLALNFVPPPGGLNANQQSAASAIVGFFNTNGTIPLVFGGLTPAGLTQLSGEVATGTQQTTFNAMGMFMGLLTDPFIAARGDPVTASSGASRFTDEAEADAYASNHKSRSKNERDAYAAIYRKVPPPADPFNQRWSVWAAGYGGSQTTDGNAALGSNNTRSSIGGVAVGADYRISPDTLAGFAVAGGATNFSVSGLGSGGSDLFQAGAFIRHDVGAAYLGGALAYGWQDITTDRGVTVSGTDLLRATFNANAWSGRVEGGYRFVSPSVGGVGITPYAAGQFVTFDLPAYAEQAIAGANTFALSYASKNVTDTRSELGLRTDKSFAVQNGIFTLRGRAAWAHDFNTDRSIVPTFQTLPGASFVVNGAAPAQDSALVTASAEMKWLNGFSLAATFEGEFSGVTRSAAGKGVVRLVW
jgi:autotransporter-associated beta strand protein